MHIKVIIKVSKVNEILINFPLYSVRTIKEVEFKGGKAGSSGHSDEQKPINAFTSDFWLSDNRIKYPVMIWYEFTSNFTPAEITFASATRRYQFVGSNDKVCNESSAWTMLSQDITSR